MPDEKVQTAIKNWAPRFIAQGVDYNDFFRTTARIERWDDWCREWCITGDQHAAVAAEAEAKGRTVSTGEANIAAAVCYHFGKFLFQDHQEEYLAAGNKSIAAYAHGLRQLDASAERVEIPFDGATMAGILRRPEGNGVPPVVLLIPGLDSTKEEFFHWENVYLKRGMATLSLDGPGQGECGYHSYIRPDYEAPVSVVLDLLARRRDVDRKRIGLTGVSLGGYSTVRVAAFEKRLKASVALAGFWNLADCWPSLNPLTRAAFQYHSGARDEQEAVVKAGELNLEGVAQKVLKPLLIIHGKEDRFFPWQQAKRIADSVGPHADLVIYENGNHVCNNLSYLYRPLIADWLKEKLG